jgi:hypothetical protein
MTTFTHALEPFFDHSDEAEYLSDDLVVAEGTEDEFRTRARDLSLLVRNLMPASLTEETVPEMVAFGEWGNDFAEFHAEFDLEGPPDAKLQNGRWHAGNGYLLEMLRVVPVVTDDEGRTYTDLTLRAFCTPLDEDPLEVLREWPDEDEENPEVERMLQSVNRHLLADATSVMLDVRYYHVEDGA